MGRKSENRHRQAWRQLMPVCLIADQCDTVEFHLTDAIEGCDIQVELSYKASSIGGSGKVAFAHGDFTLAIKCFMETRSLYDETGFMYYR
jgi:hypothetical protein